MLKAISNMGFMTTQSVTSELAELRKRAGLTQRELAALLEMQHSTYAYYEKPERYKKDALPADLVARLGRELIGMGTPPIARREVAALGGLDELQDTADMEPRGRRPVLPDARQLLDELDNVDRRSLRIMRSWLAQQPDCPNELLKLEVSARRIRNDLHATLET